MQGSHNELRTESKIIPSVDRTFAFEAACRCRVVSARCHWKKVTPTPPGPKAVDQRALQVRTSCWKNAGRSEPPARRGLKMRGPRCRHESARTRLTPPHTHTHKHKRARVGYIGRLVHSRGRVHRPGLLELLPDRRDLLLRVLQRDLVEAPPR